MMPSNHDLQSLQESLGGESQPKVCQKQQLQLNSIPNNSTDQLYKDFTTPALGAKAVNRVLQRSRSSESRVRQNSFQLSQGTFLQDED